MIVIILPSSPFFFYCVLFVFSDLLDFYRSDFLLTASVVVLRTPAWSCVTIPWWRWFWPESPKREILAARANRSPPSAAERVTLLRHQPRSSVAERSSLAAWARQMTCGPHPTLSPWCVLLVVCGGAPSVWEQPLQLSSDEFFCRKWYMFDVIVLRNFSILTYIHVHGIYYLYWYNINLFQRWSDLHISHLCIHHQLYLCML
jgi:hypothetical protein